ncbi:hypothetical protein GF380_02325 [Candidatus Uhrbacteria bacterium]|nr:hypothetical protein [Candidatus Uhrbacteria bacterium]
MKYRATVTFEYTDNEGCKVAQEYEHVLTSLEFAKRWVRCFGCPEPELNKDGQYRSQEVYATKYASDNVLKCVIRPGHYIQGTIRSKNYYRR